MSASYQKYLKYKQKYLSLMSNDKGRLRDYANVNPLNYLRSNNNESLNKSSNRLYNLNNNLYDTKINNLHGGTSCYNICYDLSDKRNADECEKCKARIKPNMSGGSSCGSGKNEFNMYGGDLSSVTSDNFMTEINAKLRR